MQSQVPELEFLGYIVAALAYTALFLRLALKGYFRIASAKAPTAFAVAVGASALWSWFAIAALSYSRPGLSIVTALVDTARYGLWFLFLLLLLQSSTSLRQAPESGWLRQTALVLVAVGAALQSFVALWVSDTGPYARLVLFGALALPVFGLILVEQLLRNVTEDSRWNAKPLCFGLLIVFGFDFYFYSQAVLFGQFDAATVSIRGGVHAVAVPFFFVAINRHSDWIGKLKISRAAAFHSASLLLAGVYLLFISAIGYYVRYSGGDWGQGLQIGLLFVAAIGLVILVSSGTLRSKLRVLIGKHFFSYRYDYRVEWLRFTTMLASQSSPQQMGGLVIRGLADMVESPAGGLWLKDRTGAEFIQTARWNMPDIAGREAVDGSFAGFLAERGWIVKIAEYRSDPQRYGLMSMPAWILSNAELWLVIPLATADELIGFVVLTKPRAAIDVNWEVTDLLKTASRQAASFLAQMSATEALLEVRKFDAFNRMSAFVVHDLKNIVTQLSLMLKNAQRLQHNPEFQQDMLMTVESSLDKMRQLILQLREGQPPVGRVAGVDLVPIAHRIGAVASARGRALDLQVVDAVATRGHEDRIERVLGHVVQNAFDATTASGTVWLKLERASGQAKVEVGDTGTGMSPEFIQTQLFKPFQTTKQHGMGIGAYESFQYVQELGGKIAVDSQLGRGTVITILLPLFEAHQGSDIHAMSAP
ncbi:MAG: XrtA/PEP-CTERM system histidine kinase PrsK [Pseudomonadota bacterium]